MAIIAHTENIDILSAKWLGEDDVDLYGITVLQDYCNEKSVAMIFILQSK